MTSCVTLQRSMLFTLAKEPITRAEAAVADLDVVQVEEVEEAVEEAVTEADEEGALGNVADVEQLLHPR
ncbi:unnamed protein product, partial [Closterium sp. NIES-53]